MAGNARWSVRTLKDCAAWYSGGTPSRAVPKYWNGAIPWISAKSLTDFYVTDSQECVTEEGARNGTRLVPKDTILFVVRGMSLKSEFRMGLTTHAVTFNQDVKALVANESIHPPFLAYAIRARTEEILQLVGEAGHGTGVLPTDRMQSLLIAVPSLPEQMRIAEVAQSLDFKLDLNRRINQTLEAMAQAIFKSWFVDFDPVKAKIAAIQEGRDPLRAAMSAISGKSGAELDTLPPEQYEPLAATAALFPEEIEESELGEIPRGWAVRAADSLTEVGIGKTPPRKEPQWFTEGQGDWRWVSIKDMGASGVFQQRSSEFLTSEAVSRFNVRVVPGRTVLLSFKLTIGRVAITDGPMVTNEAIAHFKLPSDALISSEYLYLYLKGFDYSTLGSTSSIADAVNSKTIREMPITVASRALIDRFTKSVTPLFEEMRNRQNEIASLGATRDALLPKLLSGEIEVAA